VIKTIAVFQKYCALNSREPLQAFQQGAQHHGIRFVYDDMNADAAVIWSVLWNGRMAGNELVYRHYRSQGRPVFVIDVGALRRNVTWKVALDHITAQGQYGHHSDLDPDRPKKLGIALLDKSANTDSIAIMSQHARSLSMENWSSQEEWINNRIAAVREHSDRPIVVRPHPRSKINAQLISPGVTIQTPQMIVNSYDDFDVSYNYHAVINHNSGPGIQAALHQTPVIVDVSSLAFPVSIAMQQLENNDPVDRDAWLINIAHTEYTVDELAKGVWFQRLQKFLHG